MATVRLLVAWVLMLAIPLQALAASSMLHCPNGSTAPVQSESAAPVHRADHDHASHHHHESADGVKVKGSSSDDGGFDPEHKCSMCATCSHAVAIAQTAPSIPAVPPPQSHAPNVSLPAFGWPSPVPDKPPRA
jgi:hypothetical protein